MGQIGLLTQLTAMTLRFGDVGTKFNELVLQFAETFAALFLLSLRHFDAAQQGVMTLLLLADFSLKMTALLAHHGVGGGIGAMRNLMACAFDTELIEAGFFALHIFAQVAEA